MAAPPFRIGRLMALMVPIGASMAALIRPNRGWAIVVSAYVATMLLAAILGVILRRGPGRAFWLGFALFGWSMHLLLVFGADRSKFGTDKFKLDVVEIVGLAIESVAVALSFRKQDTQGLIAAWGEANPSIQVQVYVPTMMLAFAYLGGRIGRHFAREERAPDGRGPGVAAAGRD